MQQKMKTILFQMNTATIDVPNCKLVNAFNIRIPLLWTCL